MTEQPANFAASCSFFITAFSLGMALLCISPIALSATGIDTQTASSGENDTMTLTGHAHEHHQAGTLYVCPMHPDEISEKPGSCAQCGMMLVQQTHTAQGSNEPAGLMPGMQQQDKLYICPMHPDEISDTPGSCAQCGMFLVPSEGHVEHSMHPHTVSNPNSVKQTESTRDDAMPHAKMSMSAKAKPALFWESREPQLNKEPQPDRRSQSGSMTMHKPAVSVQDAQPMSKNMTPGTMLAKPRQVMLEDPEEHAQKHQDPTYICPMHPQIISKDPDSSCPVCGMDLVARATGQDNPEAANVQQPIYICPMHPQIVQDVSGSCPICGMDLVPRENAAPSGEHPQVFLSAAVIQNMGVRTVKAQRKILSKQIRTQGIVTPDDDRMLFIHARTGGWIEKLHLITEGERVERKDVLVDFYSPWINQVQMDFITALEAYDFTSYDPSKKTEVSARLDSLRNSLRLLNVMDMDIMRIKNSRKVQNTIQLMAPQGGIVTELGVREGTYVEPYQSMFTIVDLSQVWVMVDIYEHQAPWVRKGHQAEITAPAIPGRQWSGTIDFIYPEVDPKTRTLRARIAVPNPDEALLLNMYVQIELSANASQQEVLSVPREAVIVTGEREVVIKSLGKGHFQPVEVVSGIWAENQAEILSGLNEGDEVVVSGQFLIDSESSLQASFLRMSE